MNKQTHRIYKDLLNLQGHFTDPAHIKPPEAREVRRTAHWYDDFLLLGGHEPIDPHQANDAVVASEARCAHC
jgi:hypothetical protein